MATESEDIGKALKSVIDKINFASQHRPKVHAKKSVESSKISFWKKQVGGV